MTALSRLNLIREHEAEYYKNPRKYHFVEDGFIQYELFDVPEGKAIYIVSIFVSKDARGDGTVMRKLLDSVHNLVEYHSLVTGYARVEKDNKHKERLVEMYYRFGFSEYQDDGEALYYKVELANYNKDA